MKVLLVFPPQWDPVMPYLSLPALTAYLRSNGCEVVQRDLNIETYHLFLSEDFLRVSQENALAQLKFFESKAELSQGEYGLYHLLNTVTMSGDFVIKEIEKAKRVLTTEAFYESPDAVLRARSLIDKALRLAIACYYPTRLSLDDFDMYYHQSVEGILEVVYDEKRNIFASLLREHFLSSILAERADVVGISVAGVSQLIAGLTLAALIKEQRSETHICVGGPVFSRWSDVLSQAKSLFELFDSVVLEEGELALLRLVTALEEKKGLENVPSLIYRDGQEIRINPVGKADLNSLPTPDFDGLPLDSYFAPDLILPVATSFGCYWRKCGFCDHEHFQSYYVTRDLDLVVKDFQQLTRKYDTDAFLLTDEALSYRRLESFSKKVLEADLDIKWYLFGRLEKGFTPELCELLGRAGCKIFLWAVESGCQRVLDAMDKGTNVETNEVVLRNSKEAGIWNEALIVVGFPTEEREEAQQTLNFLKEHTNVIDVVRESIFILGKYTRVEREPDRYHVTVLRDEEELRTFYLYKPERGMSFGEALAFRSHFQEEVRQVYPCYDFITPYTLLYLRVKSSTELKSMFKSIDHLQPQVDDWEKVVLGLRDGVFLGTSLFKLLKGGEDAERGEYYMLYDLLSNKSLALGSSGKEIIDLVRKGRNLGQIISKLSAKVDLPQEKIKTACITFAKDLVGKGYLAIKNKN